MRAIAFGGLFGVTLVVGCTHPAELTRDDEAALAMGDCVCGAEQVCEAATRRCLPRATGSDGDIIGEMTLLRQERIGDPSVLGKLGKAEVGFHAHEPLPVDRRPSWPTDEGERCFLERDTVYPQSYGGTYWPQGPSLGVGDAIFDVGAAVGAILLDAWEYSGGWGYSHGDTPPALHEGSTWFPSFFGPEHLPFGETFRARSAGGPDASALDVPGEIPRSFTIDQPAVETPNASASSTDGLVVRWSPPQPSAYMEIFVTQVIAGSFVLVSCKVKDDGAAVVPSAPMNQLFGDVGIQLRRTTERYAKIATPSRTLHLTVNGRVARVGRFDLTLR